MKQDGKQGKDQGKKKTHRYACTCMHENLTSVQVEKIGDTMTSPNNSLEWQKYLCKNRHSRRFLQLKVTSKDKLILKSPKQSGLKIVLSSIELGSRYSYTSFKCCILIGWPHSAVSIFNLKLSIWWSNESFPKGISYYNNSMDTSHLKCRTLRKPVDQFLQPILIHQENNFT